MCGSTVCGLALLLSASAALGQSLALPGTPAAGAAPDPATSQNLRPPPRLSFDLSSGLTYDDNPDLAVTGGKAETRFDTRMGLNLNRQTRNTSLALSLGAMARASSGDGSGLREPSARLDYKTDTGATRLSLNGLYQQTPVDTFSPALLSDGTIAGSDLVATTGTITSRTAGFNFETGVKAPLGFTLAGQYDGRSYSNTTDPGLFDTTVRSLSTGVIWRMASGAEVTLGAEADTTDYANLTQTSRRSHAVTLGYDAPLRPDLKLKLSLGQSTATGKDAGVETFRSSGLIGSIGLEQTRVNGKATATLSSERDVLGARQTLSFGRSLTLRTGSLDATLGVSGRSGGALEPVGSLTYERILPSDRFNLSLSRQIALNSDNVDQASTFVDFGWQHRINAVSSLGLSLNLAAVGGAGNGTVTGASRSTLRASWSHDLARDWQLTTGYQYRNTDQSGSSSATSNSVFLTVSRKFTLQP